MWLNLGVTLLASKTEIKPVLSYQCTVGAPVWITKDFMYRHIDLVLLKFLYMHLLYPPVESEATAG